MTNFQTDICRKYESRVINRSASRDESLLPPLESVNWADQPLKFKIYENVNRIPLELWSDESGGGNEKREPASVSYAELSKILYFSNGILRRKFEVNWNNTTHGPSRHVESNYSRGAASGGGLYPVEVYVAAGPGGPVMPGMYHYDNAHHALACLCNGDAAEKIREVCFRHPLAEDSSCFLLLSVNFWKNYFKYHGFSYQVVTQDVGAMQATIQEVAKALGIELALLDWFHDQQLNEALGLKTAVESVFSVLAFTGTEQHKVNVAPELIPANARSFQRSKRIFPLPEIEFVHRSTLVESPFTNAVGQSGKGSGQFSDNDVALPDALPLSKSPMEVLLTRCSSWGKMRAYPPLTLAKLAAVLQYVSAEQQTQHSLTRLIVIANHLENLERGVYSYLEGTHGLRRSSSIDFSLELQAHYFLQNYNLEQSAAVIAVVGALEESLGTFGNRGLRFLNHETGRAAQRAYMVSASLSIGCGAALGFDNAELNGLLGLDTAQETSLLLLFIGNEASSLPAFDFRLI